MNTQINVSKKESKIKMARCDDWVRVEIRQNGEELESFDAIIVRLNTGAKLYDISTDPGTYLNVDRTMFDLGVRYESDNIKYKITKIYEKVNIELI